MNTEKRNPGEPIENLAIGKIIEVDRALRESAGDLTVVAFTSEDEPTGQLKTWTDEGVADETLMVSVNVSKRQVAEPGFVDEVRQVLSDVGISGSRLKLEITESVIMENPDSIADVLQQFKESGIQVHMDDFGTGYSSLSYLHRFPLDVLKIDREYISTLSADTDYAEMVQTVVALAHTLNMQVIVEGVETEQQLRKLLLLNCDFAQGFYFAKPLVADDARELIASGRTWLKHAA